MSQAKKSILFVDDEKNILSGLKRMLHGMRKEWDMNFMNGGHKALEFLESHHVDVVVSDMRMPEMDGATLLNEISAKYPDVVRMVLSGQADKEEIYRSIGPSHQYLSKPCDPEKLKLVIKKAFMLRDIIQDEKLKQVVSKMKQLPSQPQIYTELTNAIHNENVSLKHIGHIIEKDPGMTAQILKLSNSAYFGNRSNITNTAQAVSYLGLDLIKSLVLSLDVFSQKPNTDLLSLDDLWEHSLQTAGIAKNIAAHMNLGEQLENEAFTSGMVHDIGHLIFAVNMPDEYFNFMMGIKKGNQTPHELEELHFGACHESVGAYLLGIWGLPDTIVEAVALHAHPEKSLEEELTVLPILHISDAIQYYGGDIDIFWTKAKINKNYIDRWGLVEKIPEFLSIYREMQQTELEVKIER